MGRGIPAGTGSRQCRNVLNHLNLGAYIYDSQVISYLFFVDSLQHLTSAFPSSVFGDVSSQQSKTMAECDEAVSNACHGRTNTS
jgi:hypothetical protein